VNQARALDPKRVRALTAADATVERVLAELPKVRYAHFATHGFFAEALLSEERQRAREYLKGWELDPERTTARVGLGGRSPLSYTGLVLAGANGGARAGPDGGILSSEAIVELPLEGLRLAVLSACDTGLGEWTEGEGVAGLQRAFHLAGCSNVVASLWKVNDEATAALMMLFYHKLWHDGAAPLEALRDAQFTLYHHPERIPVLARERGVRVDRVVALPMGAALDGAKTAPATKAPTRLWAGFVLSGVGR
jgi:CHAT domain-containing protein